MPRQAQDFEAVLRLKSRPNTDHLAREMFANIYYDSVFYRIYKLCNDPEIASDLTQDVFLEFYTRYWDGLCESRSAGALLQRMLISKHAEYWRKKQRLGNAILRFIKRSSVALGVSSDDRELRLIDFEFLTALQACLSKLPRKDQELVEDNFLSGIALRDLEAKFKRKKSSLSTQRQKILENLRLCLEGRGWAINDFPK